MLNAYAGIDCPCGSSQAFPDCCGRYIDGPLPAPTAEALMRSRYSAYVLGRETYLLDTWHPDTRPETLSLTSDQRWLGLKIRSTRTGGEDDEEGMVEFIARFKIAGRGHRLHEISTFRRLAGRWHYLDGVRGDTDSSRREDGRNGTETDYL